MTQTEMERAESQLEEANQAVAVAEIHGQHQRGMSTFKGVIVLLAVSATAAAAFTGVQEWRSLIWLSVFAIVALK